MCLDSLDLECFANFLFFFLFFLFFLFVVNFVIHWNKTAMGLHVFPIPIPPPTSLSTGLGWRHKIEALMVFSLKQLG